MPDLTVWAHDPADFTVYVDPNLIVGAKDGDLAELRASNDKKKHGFTRHGSFRSSHSGQSSIHPTNQASGNLYFQISKPLKPMSAISVNQQVLSQLKIRPRSSVKIRLLDPVSERKIHLDVVEIHFSGVYLTRHDHYQIAKALSNTCVSRGQKIPFLANSVRLTVESLFRDGKRKFSGFVGENTRIVFRSDSARILIFVQMSKEMYNFDETGDIMFHKLVNSFIPEMLHQWHDQGDAHLVSIVLFTSIRVRAQAKRGCRRLQAGELEPRTLHFYRVVVDSVHISRWSDIMDALRSEFSRFMAEVLIEPETMELRGTFLPSTKSNLLEAFSLATTLLTSKFADRDLCHTGVQAMVVTAGPACFDVDLSELYTLSRRLLGVEIGIELVCLARPPLHITPLFRARLGNPRALTGGSRLVFCVPTWINMSFWSSPGRFRKQWIPRCKIYDLQMVGILENEPRTLGLLSLQFEPNDLTPNYMRRFDSKVFLTGSEYDQSSLEEEFQPPQRVETPAVEVEKLEVTATIVEPGRSASASLGAILSGVPYVPAKAAKPVLGAPITLPAPVSAIDVPRRRRSSLQVPERLNLALRKRQNASPLKDRLLAPNTAHNSCEIELPEHQHGAMWRVLPNSATVDQPSRLTAYGRWANVYPPQLQHNGVSWHSLKSPASLPLTNEGFPSLQSFQEHYQFQFYDIAVDDETMPLPLLLDEMIGLRLHMGFQIAVGANVRAVEAALPRGNPNRVHTVVPTNASDCLGIRVYLTRIGLVHRLAVDEPGTVNLRLYTWIDRNIERLRGHGPPSESTVKIKTRYDQSYEVINKRFLDPEISNLNWSMLDLQVSGADDPLLYPSSANTQNLVSIRFAVLPSGNSMMHGHQTLSVEEGHVEGITKIVRAMLKNREAGTLDSDFIPTYYTGKLRHVINDYISDSKNSLLECNRLNKQISLSDLAVELQGPMGLEFKDRRWHWKHFTDVLLGHDLVVWLLKTFEDIETLEDAEQYGADLMKQGLLRHPENRHPFLYGHYFYEITPKYKTEPARRSVKGSKSGPSGSSGTGNSPKAGTNAGTMAVTKGKVHISGSFVMNMDTRGISKRPERVKVSLDRTHNPKNAYHILLEWLNATPRLIDDYFSSLGRLAATYGLKLVQVPVLDVMRSLESSPFRSALSLKVCIELNDPEESRWFRHYLLRKSGYILDLYDSKDINTDEYEVLFMWGRLRSALPQYIHKSGFILVQVEGDGTLKVTPNTLHLSRAVMVSRNAEQECEAYIQSLSALCSNTDELQKMLLEGRASQQLSGQSSTQTSTQSSTNPTRQTTPRV